MATNALISLINLITAAGSVSYSLSSGQEGSVSPCTMRPTAELLRASTTGPSMASGLFETSTAAAAGPCFTLMLRSWRRISQNIGHHY
uniref:Secreted protein n=1 Tax=Nothobranchius kadleci TaxID=1051664 RepID=A0A1A8D2N7_NOTKA